MINSVYSIPDYIVKKLREIGYVIVSSNRSCLDYQRPEIGATHPPPSNLPHPTTFKENEFPMTVVRMDDSSEDVVNYFELKSSYLLLTLGFPLSESMGWAGCAEIGAPHLSGVKEADIKFY